MPACRWCVPRPIQIGWTVRLHSVFGAPDLYAPCGWLADSRSRSATHRVCESQLNVISAVQPNECMPVIMWALNPFIKASMHTHTLTHSQHSPKPWMCDLLMVGANHHAADLATNAWLIEKLIDLLFAFALRSVYVYLHGQWVIARRAFNANSHLLHTYRQEEAEKRVLCIVHCGRMKCCV